MVAGGDQGFASLGLLWVGLAGGDCGFIFVCDFGGCECGWWWPVAVGVGSGYGFVGSRKDEMRIKIIIKL